MKNSKTRESRREQRDFVFSLSLDINKTSLFPKFQLIPILRFQVMHDYVCFIAPIGNCVEKSHVRDFL